jgi:D-alanyl-D-alanine carboxypeptidase
MTRAVLVALSSLGALACGDTARFDLQPEDSPPTLLAPSDAADLAPLIEPLRAQYGLPALAAGVVRDGELLAVGAVGLDRGDGETPATVDERYHIGSNAKAMTATMIARLVQRGVLSWDDTVGAVLADLEPHEGWSAVTLEQLLTHRSGLPANPGTLWMVRLVATAKAPTEARRAMLGAVLAEPPLHEPGSAYLYSNLGFATAAAMAEAVTGASYAALMEQEVFGPLGVVDYGFGPPPPPSPLGHVGNPGKLTPVESVPVADNPRALEPAGTLHFTMASWARFVGAHVDGARGEREDYLPAEGWAELHRPRLEDYAMGWGALTPEWLGEPALTHSGSNSMWYARVVAVPSWDAAFLVATNCGGDACKAAVKETIRTLADEWRPRLQPPVSPEGSEPQSP